MAGLTTGQSPKTVEQGGTIGVIASELARYSDFCAALAILLKPPDARLIWTKAADVVGNSNTIFRNVMGEWVWLLGDDHVFEPDCLLRLLAHDVDIVVPLVLMRTPPYAPVVTNRQMDDLDEHGNISYEIAFDLPASGLHEVQTAGSAGMLVRRHVIEAMPDPWFETDGRGLNEDFTFCRKAREAGFRIWCDVDTPMGHIAPHTVWPDFRDGAWAPNLVLDNQGTVVPLRYEREQPKRSKLEIVRG